MAETGLDVPTLKELFVRTRDDFDSNLPNEGAKIRRSFLYVSSAVLSGAVHGLYKLAGRVSKNIILDRTDDEEIIVRWATLYGVTRDPGALATGTLNFTGTPTTAIPAGTQIERDDGTTYTTDALGTIPGGGDIDIAVTAGAIGTAANVEDITEELSLSEPLSGISSVVTVTTKPVGGLGVEGIESLRTRAIENLRDTRQGGAAADYVAWAKEAPGVASDVSRVWIGQEGGPGTVTVWFAVTGTGAAVIPTISDKSAVWSYIQETDTDLHAIRRPVTASVEVYRPTAEPQDFTIGIYPHSAALEAIVETELESMLSTEASVKRTGFVIPTIKNSAIHEAMVRTLTQGIEFYTIDAVGPTGTPGPGSADITPAIVGGLPTLGSVTYIAL